MSKKNKFDKAWMSRHINDPFVKQAQKQNYRARAAYKLIEIDEREKLLFPGVAVADLGSAPGSWCQVVRRKLGDKAVVVAVDLLPMEPVAGVNFVQGDFRDPAVVAQLLAFNQGMKFDLVISDMAPNITGVSSLDQARAIHLAELALAFVACNGKLGCNFVTKLFQGEGFVAYQKLLAQFFDKTVLRKPEASRDSSKEVFLVGKGYNGAEPDWLDEDSPEAQ